MARAEAELLRLARCGAIARGHLVAVDPEAVEREPVRGALLGLLVRLAIVNVAPSIQTIPACSPSPSGTPG